MTALWWHVLKFQGVFFFLFLKSVCSTLTWLHSCCQAGSQSHGSDTVQQFQCSQCVLYMYLPLNPSGKTSMCWRLVTATLHPGWESPEVARGFKRDKSSGSSQRGPKYLPNFSVPVLYLQLRSGLNSLLRFPADKLWVENVDHDGGLGGLQHPAAPHACPRPGWLQPGPVWEVSCFLRGLQFSCGMLIRCVLSKYHGCGHWGVVHKNEGVGPIISHLYYMSSNALRRYQVA